MCTKYDIYFKNYTRYFFNTKTILFKDYTRYKLFFKQNIMTLNRKYLKTISNVNKTWKTHLNVNMTWKLYDVIIQY